MVSEVTPVHTEWKPRTRCMTECDWDISWFWWTLKSLPDATESVHRASHKGCNDEQKRWHTGVVEGRSRGPSYGVVSLRLCPASGPKLRVEEVDNRSTVTV